MNSQIIRKRITFFGRVQGVGFRYTASYAANSCGVTGWVRNEYNGSVTMEIQGTEEQIYKTLSLINNGRYIQIDRTESRNLTCDPNERSFRVRY
ncbi:MAG: acylphosphatase [Ruminococcus sp.]|nr:acylphosphatase [Ruminococcus sp.]